MGLNCAAETEVVPSRLAAVRRGIPVLEHFQVRFFLGLFLYSFMFMNSTFLCA
ncbi:hypothetical protein HMPREF3150_01628 [Pseudomonas aeruginosa]|nr:hypothetical protein HMPREF3150_01628 [Pseudomonas aeruginosa]